MKKNLQTAFLTRQYMLSKDFEIYYYNDKNLPEVGLHSHDYYEFYFFLEGSVSIQIDEEIYPLRSGDIILMLPGIFHRPIIHDGNIPYRRFVLWISKDYYNSLLAVSPAYGYLAEYALSNKTYVFHNKQISFNTIQSMILHLLEELHADRFGREAQLTLCLHELLLHLNRMVFERSHPKMQNKVQTLSHNILTYIEDHIEEDLSLDTLAAVFFVSKYHIAHIFKENFGMSVHRYITKKRLALCREALPGCGNITDVYLAFGFGDYSSFYRAFMKEYGVSPKAFKQMHGEASFRQSLQAEQPLPKDMPQPR